MSEPTELSRSTGEPAFHTRMSRSWQHLASSIGLEEATLRQLPRTKLWAMCQ